MCVITGSMIATALTTVGATSLAGSTMATTIGAVGANVALGAASGAAMTAATGGDNYALGIGLGAAGGALGSAFGVAGEAVDALSTTAAEGITETVAESAAPALSEMTPEMIEAVEIGTTEIGTESLSTAASNAAISSAPQMEMSTAMEIAETGMNGGVAATPSQISQANSVIASSPSGAAAQKTSETYFGLTAKEWGVAAGLGSGAISAASSISSANATADSQEDEAKLAGMRADLSRQNALNSKTRAGQEMEAGELQAADKARIARQQKGSGLAQLAGNGVMIEGRKESVSTMYEADSAAELAYDQAKIMQNAEMRAWGYINEARIHEMEAISNDFSSSSLRSSAKSTRLYGTLGGLATGAIQGVSTGVSAASLLI